MPKRASAKDTVLETVLEMPEGTSFDEILRTLIVNRLIDQGLADVEAGRTITDAEIRRTVDSWPAPRK